MLLAQMYMFCVRTACTVPAVVLGSTRYGRGGEDVGELGELGDTTRTLPADYLAALMALFLLMVADRTVSARMCMRHCNCSSLILM
jgi:hypothetical protein